MEYIVLPQEYSKLICVDNLTWVEQVFSKFFSTAFGGEVVFGDKFI